MLDPFSSALELAKLVRRREVSPVELVDFYLEQIGRHDPAHNAFCDVADHEAREIAQRLTRQRNDSEQPPFFGVPIGIKDLHPVAGWPLCNASNGTDHPVMAADSPAVKALRDAGFVFLGSTISPEFGTCSVTESARHGVTRNPWDPSVSSGGSSGGSAAAVAVGMLPVGHGSDGAGSIREPSSYCGLVGLKPSRGRVPASAQWTAGLTTEGVLTRTVQDTAALLDVFDAVARRSKVVPPPPRAAGSFLDSTKVRPARLRIGVNLQPALPADVDPRAKKVLFDTADLLTGLGHEVVEARIPGLDPEWLQARFEIIYMTSSASVREVDEELIEPLNRAMRQRARETDSFTYVQALYDVQLRAPEMLSAWDDLHVIVTPTNPIPATPEGRLWDGQDEDPLLPLRRAEETASFTVLANMLGLPAVSLPLFTQPDGMPLGVQLIGRSWDDSTVLALAAELEGARPWRDRHPGQAMERQVAEK